jgi:predicted GH43/DUF377 family glycosyl hydrolase
MRIPSVLQQGVPVTALASAFHAYNSGTLDGRRFLSRAFDPLEKRSRLIWQRRQGDRLKAEELFEIPGQNNYEDGRIFSHGGRAYAAYTEGVYHPGSFLAIQQVALLGPDWQPEEIHRIDYAANGRRSEKNWQFFSHDGVLHFIYSIVPHLVVPVDRHFGARQHFVSGGTLNWPWGEVLRGGTPPLFWQAQRCYITFFHSHTEHRDRNRRYAMGAYLFEPEPPFAIRAFSPALLRASNYDATVPNPSVRGWNPLVVFPVGAWWEGETINVSLGVNDSFDAIARFDPAKIEWREPGQYSVKAERYFEATNGPVPLVRRGQVVHWNLRAHTAYGSPKGYLATGDPNLIALIEDRQDTREIDAATFKAALSHK